MITYRKAKPEDIYPAFELALRVFIEFEAPDYEQDAVGKFKSDCIDKEGMLFHRTAHKGNNGHTWFQEVWIFKHDCPIEAVRFQEGETCDAMWVTADKICGMMAAGEFLSERFYPYFDEMVDKWRVKL